MNKTTSTTSLLFYFSKAKFFIPLFLLCISANAQLLEVNPMGVTESTYTPEQLIRNVLVSGACANANVSNVSAVVETANDPSDRENKSYGYFRRPAGSSFPFAEGVILTSGRAYQAGNTVIPRENPLSADSNGTTTDADLIASTGGGDFGNTTSFEFNFTTSSDQISFRYIMASEEYAQTFPCSFADSFAFLLKPATSGTYENIALVPGTTTPISVVNVRPDIPGTCGAQNEEYFEGYNVGDTNYNGRTVVLTAQANVTPNVEYTIKLVIADSGDSEYDSAVFLESGSFNLGLDLGNDFSIATNNAVCGATEQLLTANVTAPAYKWYKDGVEIPGETGQTYLANLGNGVYTCEIPNGTGCAESDDILVEFVDGAAINPAIANVLECDTDGDLVVSFNFRDKDTEILNGQDPADFEVQYFTDSAYTMMIADPTNYMNVNATETIYARVVNRTSTNCVADGTFTIQVIGEPTPTAPTDYIVCDNTSVGTDIDGFTSDLFMLNTKDLEILGTLDPADYTVTYHTTLVGAQTSSTTDVIDKTVNYQNTTAFSQTVYVRVENNLDANCNHTSLTMNLVVVPQPKSNAITNILSCSSTGTEVYDLHALKDAEMLAGQDPTIFNVVYYPTQNDALNDTNRLPTPNAYSNLSAYSTDTIWARTFHTAHPTTCVDVNIATTSFQIFVTQDPDGLIQTPVDVSDCDDTADGDDTNGFINNFITLSSKDAEILNNVAFANTALYTVSYHRSSADATNDANPIDKVNPYTNETANNQTIYVRVEHNDNPLNCVAYTNFDLIVHPLPVYATTNIVDLKQCDDDTDGFSDFNLTEANILISADHLNETFVYYPTLADAQADTNPIANPIAFTNRVTPTDIVWARAITVNGCYRIAQVNLIVSTTGIPATFSRTFNTCDDFLPTDGVTGANDDTDGVSLFDFSSVDAEVRALFPVTQQLTITYYRNNADALAEINAITDISNYRNIGYPGSQSIYIRVDSNLDNGCLGFGPYITLNVDPVPVANPVGDYALCETLDDGDGTNGIIQTFDLESQTAAILGSQNPANYTVTYHASAADALSGANSLASPYTNTVRDRQTIYVRVTGSAAGCFTNHTTFDIVVDPLPVANFVPDLEVCDDNSDGSARNGFSQSIDLESQTAGILGTQDPTQFTVTYHRDLAEAQAGTNPQISPFSNTTPNRQTIYVRVYNSITQCANGISNFDVVVNPEPIFDTVSNLSVCDDNDDGDDANGFVQDIDLNSQIPDILGPTQDPDDFNVTFHESQADATSGMNPFANPFSNTIANQQTIYVRIQNKATGCVNDDASFEVIVNPLPDFQVTTPQIVCLNGPTLTIRVENPADIYDYVWTDPNGNNIVGSFLTISSGGLYTITATTTNGTGCTRTRTIQVNESIIATITQDDVTIVDDSDNNSITIDPTNLGIGDYEYALTNENNVMIRNYQDQPLFENLEGGFYNILVRDKNGCGEVSLLVSVVEFPKFFTPNNDGVNDTWIVKGANSTFFPESSIYIFNRYGKVVANIPIDSQGWTGDYGGNRLPSDDYWFSIRLVDPNGTIRERKGNFSLLRK